MLTALVLLLLIGYSTGIRCYYSEEIGDEVTKQCIGDRCAAYGVADGAMRQYCLDNVATFDSKPDGCYEGEYAIHCLCSTDLCNNNSLVVNSPVIVPNKTQKCFIGMKGDECVGQRCIFTKLYNEEIDYWCSYFDVLLTKFPTFFPDVVVLIAQSQQYKSWDPKDTTSFIETFDQDFSCSGENCEQRFNSSISNFPTSSKPLVKCHLIAHPIKVFVWESSAAIERQCLGHFCFLREIRGYEDIPTQIITGCLRVDDRNATRKVMPSTLVSGYETLYICNKDYCNRNKTTAGKGGLEVINNANLLSLSYWLLPLIIALVHFR